MTDPEDKKESQPEADAAAKPKKTFPMIPVLVGGGVFILSLAFFSFKFGLFSGSEPSQPTTESEIAKVDSAAHNEEAVTEKDPYDELFAGFDDAGGDEQSGDTAAERDSVGKVEWYLSQKQEIDQKMLQLNLEQTRLETLKGEVEMLLAKRKSLEEGNINQMAKLYEGMSTEEVVPILSNLTDAQVSVMISKMKKQKASEVLGKLPPERAAKITQHIISMDGN